MSNIGVEDLLSSLGENAYTMDRISSDHCLPSKYPFSFTISDGQVITAGHSRKFMSLSQFRASFTAFQVLREHYSLRTLLPSILTGIIRKNDDIDLTRNSTSYLILVHQFSFTEAQL